MCSTISAISNAVLKRTIPTCPYNFPITKTRSITTITTTTTYTQSQRLIFSAAGNHVCRVSNFPYAEGDPSGDPPEKPLEAPTVVPKRDRPSVLHEVPPLTTSPEIDPGGTPAVVIENPQPDSPDPKPEIDFPKPDLPPGPDILPPGPEIDPPLDVPPVRPPGPEIVPPPNLPPDIRPPPGSPNPENPTFMF